MLNTPEGQRFIWRLLDKCNLIGVDLFTGNSHTFHRLGGHDIGVWVYQEIMDANPEAFIKVFELMIKEHKENG